MKGLLVGLLTTVTLAAPCFAEFSDARDGSEAAVKGIEVAIEREVNSEHPDRLLLKMALASVQFHASAAMIDDAIIRYQGGEPHYPESEPLLRLIKKQVEDEANR